MQSLVSLAIMLASEGLATYSADERALIGMSTEMRSEIVSASKLLRTQITLKSGRVFLDSAFIGRWWTVRVGQFKDVVAIWD